MVEEEYNELVKLLFHSKKWEKRAEAARKIGSLSDGKATNILVRALNKEEDPSVINRIIEALGKIKDAKATMPVIEFLKKELEKSEPDNTRLFIIVESLMRIGDKRALSHLGLLHESCEADIKALTVEALECIDPDWKTTLKQV
ncbi:MAG: HEAT repeat domain-containing protein [Promethearchaeota archaeon]